MTPHVEHFGRGRPVVLLHGWGFHSGVWAPVLPRLGERFALHCVDLPGHGRSRAVRLRGLDSLVDEIAPCVPDGSLVAGWSLGALAAMRLAHRHPSRVRALALIAGTPCFLARDGWPHGVSAAALEEFASGVRSQPQQALEGFVRLNSLGAHGARRAIRTVCAALRGREAPDPGALEAGLAILREADLRGEALALRVNTCVIHGVEDAVVPVGAGRWLAGAITGARLVELARSAHLPFVSEPEEVCEAIEALDG
jgi:pimeloyl-[acyl-carrier protein] methyl ester esterase